MLLSTAREQPSRETCHSLQFWKLVPRLNLHPFENSVFTRVLYNAAAFMMFQVPASGGCCLQACCVCCAPASTGGCIHGECPLSCAPAAKAATQSIYVGVYFRREGLTLLGKQEYWNPCAVYCWIFSTFWFDCHPQVCCSMVQITGLFIARSWVKPTLWRQKGGWGSTWKGLGLKNILGATSADECRADWHFPRCVPSGEDWDGAWSLAQLLLSNNFLEAYFWCS